MGKKRGIVLSGGGARGAYQIGVLKVLKAHGLLDNIHAISGSSVGSLNAVMLSTGDLDKAEKIWFDIDNKKIFKSDKNLFNKIFHEGADVVHEGLYPTSELINLIDETIDFEALKKHPVYIATSYVGEGEASFWELLTVNIRNFFSKEPFIRYTLLNELSEENIKKTLLASCAIPVFFKPIMIEGKTYYDGGVLDNAPFQPLIDAGCDEVIVIDLFRFRKHHKCPKEIKVYRIKPSRNLHGILDFSKSLIQKRFDYGVSDAEKFIKDTYCSEETE